MFTITYVAVNGEMENQTFDSNNRAKLTVHLASFNRPISAVYEQASPITKAARSALAEYTGPKTTYAVDFVNSRP